MVRRRTGRGEDLGQSIRRWKPQIRQVASPVLESRSRRLAQPFVAQ